MIGTVEEHTASYIGRLMVSVHCDLDDNAWKRVTGVVIYRAVVADGLTLAERSEFQQVYSFTADELADMRGTIEDPSKDPQFWNSSYARWMDNNTVLMGSSYANDSGLDEAVTFTNLGYEVACEMNNFLFVGNVGWKIDGVQQLTSGARMLYRSLRGKFCQFKIIDDYLALPFIPVAITTFNNRLIVFGSAEFAVVNPESMVIEEVINGYGLESRFNVLTTLYGVFFANKNNMYVYDGQQVTPIGTPLLRADISLTSVLADIGIITYEQLLAQRTPINGIQRVVYAPRINAILFLFARQMPEGPSPVYAYVFSLNTKTWSVARFTSPSAKSAYVDRNNILYVGGVQIMESADKVADWKFVTARFDMGAISQAKKFYGVYSAWNMRAADSSASFNGGAFVALDGVMLTADKRRANNIMLKYEPSEENAVLNGIEITYREMLNIQ
jgi:hypothetical protein